MRRWLGLGLGGLVLVSSGGCLAIAGNTVNAERYAARQAVVVDGQLCIVDVCTGEVMKLPEGNVETAGPFRPVEPDIEP